ncbi:replication initiation protein [Runella salmonicolor]|uniref:Replication initiation protein n=1 Tax=Runella salmonicolor TaxID=2950278 RepID=A0ABT1FXJ3_9BACT|nr:replication initiation protein [Runella salmonicolor]MCP1386491.1 replication initiation protein [Runella salmonicolor]
MSKKIRKEYVKEDVRFIKKANELVEARYKFDIWETRIFAITLSMIHPSDADFKEYKINVGQVIDEFGLSKGGEIYQFLREAALGLQKKIIAIQSERDGFKTELTIPLFTGIERVIDERAKKDTEKSIWVTFEPRLKPFLLELKARYLIYDIRSILSIKSVHSIRIYELLKQYEKIGSRTFDIDELKLILGIAADEYALYGHFKDKVILKAQEDLNANRDTDIKFSFEEIKQGRKVVRIKFNILTHLPERKQLPELPLFSTEEGTALNELLVLTADLIPEQTLQQWLSKYAYNDVKTGIVYTLNRIKAGEKIKNIPAYMAKMISTKGIIDPIEVKRQNRTKIAAQQQQKANERVALEYELENLRIDHYEKQKLIVAEIFEQTPETRQQIIEGLKYSRDWDRKKDDAENLNREHVQTLIFMKAMQKFPERFSVVNKNFELKEAELKSKLRLIGWLG